MGNSSLIMFIMDWLSTDMLVNLIMMMGSQAFMIGSQASMMGRWVLMMSSHGGNMMGSLVL